MATQKGNKSSQSSNDLGWSNRISGAVRGGSNVANNEKRDSEDVPWSLIVTVLAVLLTFFIVMPVLGFMYVDLMNLREAMQIEIRKMKELRRDVLIERMYGQ